MNWQHKEMDDNEAEVDLAVSTSLLLVSGKAPPFNDDPNGGTNDDLDPGKSTYVDEGPQINVKTDDVETTDIVEENVPESTDDMVGSSAENADSENDDEEDGGKTLFDGEKVDDLPSATIDGNVNVDDSVDYEISRDHISPQPYLIMEESSHEISVNNDNRNVDNTATTVTVESSTSPTPQTKVENQSPPQTEQNINTSVNEEESSSDISNGNRLTDFERPPSTSIGKVINVICKGERENEADKTLTVKIVDATYKKPFLGGFRHKTKGTEFLNASSQTYPKKRIPNNVEQFCRDTQTVQKKSQIQQTTYNTSTQMTKPGCYVSDEGDVVRIPGRYVSAAEKEKIMLEKIIIIQCYWRRWLATRYVEKLRQDRELRAQWEFSEANRISEERVERLRQEFERRMKPKTKADFDLLYAALEKWRQEEMDRINNNHSGPERKAALIALLEQESYLIQSIERHRLIADENNHTENVVNFLDRAAQPKFWRAYDGKKTEMNTKHTLRAQELRDLYSSLQMKYLNQDERLDVLLTLKHTVKEHDCKLTQELIELIDREADLLTRNVKSTNLEGLRQRISTLFLQYCKTPTFNPDVARLLKVPTDSSTLRKDVYFCPSCNSYLPSTEFPLASNSRIVGRCKKCSKLDNNARLRHDFTKIRNILQHLRRSEEDQNDGSKIAFIIQDADLRYLIEKIWNSQSALSGVDDLYDLVFVRWNKYEHWSPWNCLLLTKEEASAHIKLEGVAEAYGRIFVGKIHHRHVVAKQYFSKLTKIANNMTKTSVPTKIKTTNKIETAVI